MKKKKSIPPNKLVRRKYSASGNRSQARRAASHTDGDYQLANDSLECVSMLGRANI